MFKRILGLRDSHFFVMRYSLAGLLFIWHIWPQFIHDFARPRTFAGTEYMVLWDEMVLNLVILFLLAMFPLASAIIAAGIEKHHIVNIRRMMIKRFVTAARQLWDMRSKDVFNHKRDGFKPLVMQIVEVVLLAVAVGLIMYWILAFYILFGWLVVAIYLGITELPGIYQKFMAD